MAELIDRLPQNVPGPYFVDSSCIDCDQCRSHAPLFFARHPDLGQSLIVRQPITPEEFAQCEEALDGCPTESIGRQG